MSRTPLTPSTIPSPISRYSQSTFGTLKNGTITQLWNRSDSGDDAEGGPERSEWMRNIYDEQISRSTKSNRLEATVISHFIKFGAEKKSFRIRKMVANVS